VNLKEKTTFNQHTNAPSLLPVDLLWEILFEYQYSLLGDHILNLITNPSLITLTGNEKNRSKLDRKESVLKGLS